MMPDFVTSLVGYSHVNDSSKEIVFFYNGVTLTFMFSLLAYIILISSRQEHLVVIKCELGREEGNFSFHCFKVNIHLHS